MRFLKDLESDVVSLALWNYKLPSWIVLSFYSFGMQSHTHTISTKTNLEALNQIIIQAIPEDHGINRFTNCAVWAYWKHIVIGSTIPPMCIFINFEFLVSLDSEFQAALICNIYYVKKRHVNDVSGQNTRSLM